MADDGRPVLGRKPGAEPFRDEDRAVATAGAADGDGEIALALALERRKQRQKELGERAEERSKGRIGGDELPDLGIAAGQGAQRRVVMRIAQEAHIENEIGLTRE